MPPAVRMPNGGVAVFKGSCAVGPGQAPAPQLASLRIAVLDNDSGFLLVLAKRLELLEWEYRVLAATIPIKKIAAMRLDALVIDPAVLGPTSWDWLQRLCQAHPKYRIVVCTGPSTVTERVRGLEMGADAWLSKPCHPEELLARIEAVVGHRRQPEPRNIEPVTLGEVEIRRDQYQAFVAGRSLRLTRREFELIDLLASADGEIFERELIYKHLWGPAMARNDRSVDVFVHKLRHKLARASPNWSYIHTHWGVGYRFSAESSALREPEPVAPELTVPALGDRLAA
ncbi:MAG TPA: response regulator transcription factor [Solirubrobacteraceae bacterium]|nr:response regulator transcription factor [Solirubrobacteraceae bacterium]